MTDNKFEVFRLMVSVVQAVMAFVLCATFVIADGQPHSAAYGAVSMFFFMRALHRLDAASAFNVIERKPDEDQEDP